MYDKIITLIVLLFVNTDIFNQVLVDKLHFDSNESINNYKGEGYSFYGSSDVWSCMKDVKCYPDWCNQRRSVALVMIYNDKNEYIGTCTGSLLTNGRRDLKPYFLTAFHCLDIDENGELSLSEIDALQYYIFKFNYQNQNCGIKIEPSSEYVVTGASLVAANCLDADFALLELSQRPSGNFNTYLNGWYIQKKEATKGACISHPMGDVKKIAIFEKIKLKKVNTDTASCGVIKTWQVKWDVGGVASGSSGSPLFDEFNRVVGQLKGSIDGKECKKANFGRLDISWDASSNPTERLYDWLHGTQSNIVSMSGDEPCKINYTFQNANDLHTSANVSHLGPVYPGDRTYNGVYECTNEITIGNNVTIQSGTNVVMNAGYRIVALPGSKSELGSTFHAYIDGCLRGCDNLVGRTDNSSYEQYEYQFANENDTQAEKIDEDGIDDYVEIKIYPNPSTGIFTIESEESINPQQIEIYDIFGKRIQPLINQNGNALSLNLVGYSKGMYFIKIGTYSQKIIVE